MWQNELFFCLLYTFFDPFLLLYIPINGGGVDTGKKLPKFIHPPVTRQANCLNS